MVDYFRDQQRFGIDRERVEEHPEPTDGHESHEAESLPKALSRFNHGGEKRPPERPEGQREEEKHQGGTLDEPAVASLNSAPDEPFRDLLASQKERHERQGNELPAL